MSWTKKIRQIGRALLRKQGVEQELADEMRFHLERQAELHVAAGMAPKDAREKARREFGGAEQFKEECRDARGAAWIENLLQDLRYGLRMLARTPGFAAVAVLTLALGIGANTAIFSVVNAVLLRPLPFPDSERLVMIWSTDTRSGGTEDVGSYPDYADWKARSRSYTGIAAFVHRSMTLSGEQAELVDGLRVAPGFFETLGVAPELGRVFRAEEQEPGASNVALISDNYWRTHFAARPDILGQTMRLNADWMSNESQVLTIVGVMPPGFKVSPGEQEKVYVPLEPDPSRGHGFLHVLARLKPGVSGAQAQAEMNILTQQLAREYPKYDAGVGANVEPLADALVGRVRMGLFIFLGVVALVLLIACTNVANLMLARSAARQKELAVRAALGAGRVRIMQQLLTESTVLALAGGALGLLLASWSVPLLARLLAKNFQIPRIETTHTDVWVLGFTMGLSLLTGIVFGIMPALAAASPDLNQDLRESGRSASGGLRGRRVRGMLVIIETAMALILLAGAGLLLKSMLVMRSTAPGFETGNLLTADFWLPRSKFSQPLARARFFDDVLARVNSMPGVRSAALVADLPLGGGSDGLGFHIVGRPDPAPGHMFDSGFNIASPGYFRTMAIPIRAGREFSDQDSVNTPGVIIINESAAAKFWPGENAIGKQINLPGPNNANILLTVIGVAGDIRQRSLGSAPRPEMFLDFMQPGPPWPWLVLVVRTSRDPQTMTSAIRDAAGTVDSNVPILQVRTMDDVLANTLAQPGVFTLLLGIFASLAMALAAVGLYGVVSYTVTQRMHEMGIRVALGARRSDILRLVLRHGFVLTLAGIAVGLGGAIAFMRVLTHLDPSVQPGDPLTLFAVCALLLGVAMAASVVPARRATHVDPVIALRYE